MWDIYVVLMMMCLKINGITVVWLKVIMSKVIWNSCGSWFMINLENYFKYFCFFYYEYIYGVVNETVIQEEEEEEGQSVWHGNWHDNNKVYRLFFFVIFFVLRSIKTFSVDNLIFLMIFSCRLAFWWCGICFSSIFSLLHRLSMIHYGLF